jgi:hypothetical protein
MENKVKCILYDEPDVVEVVKIGRLRWLGHLFRMQELESRRKLTVLKPEAPDVWEHRS